MEMTITPENKTANGAFCLFVRLNEMHGVKFYRTAKERNEAMALQDAAHAVACGPAVHSTLEMAWLHSWNIPNAWDGAPKRVYGYVTDIVDVAPLSWEEYDSLKQRLKFHNIYSPDIGRRHNVGKTLSGVPIKYDFDPITNT